jgi:hypothetical protein
MTAASPGNTRIMLPTIAGVVMTVGTLSGLCWDWFRHPDL